VAALLDIPEDGFSQDDGRPVDLVAEQKMIPPIRQRHAIGADQVGEQ
jgi:hypothetical protein